ncbi:hypothetical protein GOP47_0030479 [Adiantum capillus-veneris]|nr:hypothetical protein GOP47_0030479 [Adiantum capillus-veneris]
MFLNCLNQKLAKMKDADFSMNGSVRCCRPKCQAMQWTNINANASHGGEASVRRVLVFQVLAVFGTMLCMNPIVVDGLARAQEQRSFLIFDPSKVSIDEVVLRGLPYTANLGRPSTSPELRLKDDELEEILSVKLKLLRSKASAFRIFINLPDANEKTPVTCAEFSGSYFHEPRRVKSPDYELQVTTFQIGISDIIKDLGLWDQPSILVTFVPCGVDKGLPVVLESMGIELE